MLLARKPVMTVAGDAPAPSGKAKAASKSHKLSQVDAAVDSNLDALKDQMFRLELRRQAGTLQLTFDERFERQTLERALAVERECCPFFEFELAGQRLRVTVAREAHRPALDALAWAFEGARRVGGRS